MISIIMPLYNTEEFVSEAIQSVLDQTFKDFELIIIDDGSTDNSLEKVRSFNFDNRITCIVSKKNRGIGIARNKGIQLAKGEHIAFLSSDDIWKPNFLELMHNNLKKGIIFCNYEIIHKNGGHVRTEKLMPEDNIYTYPTVVFQKLAKSTALENGMLVNYSGILGEKKYFEKKNDFGDFRFGEDLYHLIKICEKAPFTYLPEALIKYRWHEDNTTNKVQHLMTENNQKIFKLLREEGINI